MLVRADSQILSFFVQNWEMAKKSIDCNTVKNLIVQPHDYAEMPPNTSGHHNRRSLDTFARGLLNPDSIVNNFNVNQTAMEMVFAIDCLVNIAKLSNI